MINLSKYQQTAKRIIEVLKSDEFELDMQFFNSKGDSTVSHQCGTTFCIAGWLAFKDNYPSEYYIDEWFNHAKYSEDLIGSAYIRWQFIFGMGWPNDKEKAIQRAEYVLNHNDCPDRRLWNEYK